MRYHNLIDDFLLTDSLLEKINLLLKHNVCSIKEGYNKEFKDKLNLLDSLDIKGYNHEKCIAEMECLVFNQSIIDEVGDTISDLLIKNPNEMSSCGIGVREKYKRNLLACVNSDLKEKLILKTLKKGVKKLGEICEHDLNFFISANESLTLDNLPILAHQFYLGYREQCVENKIIINEDVIEHVAPPSPDLQLNIYKVGESFLMIQDFLNLIKLLSSDLKALKHGDLIKQGLGNSRYNIQNIIDKKNRCPQVFKDAYSCEFFIYFMSFEKIDNSILFSYCYDIFKSDGLIKRKMKPKYYLQFINSLYGLNEIRIRKNEISTKRHGEIVNQLIKSKKDFDKEIANETN